MFDAMVNDTQHIVNGIKAAYDAFQTHTLTVENAVKWGAGIVGTSLGAWVWNKVRSLGWTWLLLPVVGFVWFKAVRPVSGVAYRPFRLSDLCRKLLSDLSSHPGSVASSPATNTVTACGRTRVLAGPRRWVLFRGDTLVEYKAKNVDGTFNPWGDYTAAFSRRELSALYGKARKLLRAESKRQRCHDKKYGRVLRDELVRNMKV